MTGYGNTDVRTTNKLYASADWESELSATLNKFGEENKLMATCVAITDEQGDTVLLISVDANYNDTTPKLVAKATGVPVQNITISSGHQHSTPTIRTTSTTDYARTYHLGVVAAAKAAMADRRPAEVSAGILDTTKDGNQYNFVRNVTITVKKDYNYKLLKSDPSVSSAKDKYTEVLDDNGQNIVIAYGQDQTYNITDNHYGVDKSLYENIVHAYSGSTVSKYLDAQELMECFDIKYESEVDTTMQLVKFSQNDGTSIVLANFQTHPHKGGSSTSYYVHSDVIGAFRYHLNKETGADVIYFSGAGGNVNTTGRLSDNKLSTDNDTLTDINLLWYRDYYKTMSKIDNYGKKLAALVKGHLNSGEMEPVTGAKDVVVTSKKVTYTIQPANVSDAAIERIKTNILNWDAGGYKDGFQPTEFQSKLWYEMVGQFGYDQAEEKIYSAYHASKVRTRVNAYATGKTTGQLTISAYNIGGIGFVVAPYEMFQESGQAIKGNALKADDGTPLYKPTGNQTNLFDYTIIASQANGTNGYIGTEIAYENGGGYSSTDNSIYARGTAEAMVNEYISMLNSMYK